MPERRSNLTLTPALMAVLLVVVAAGAFWLGRRGGPVAPPPGADSAAAGKDESKGESKGDNKAGGDEAKDESKTIAFSEEALKTAGITVAPVTLQQLATSITFNGQIAPNANSMVRIASVVPGRVTRLNVVQGDSVRAGEVVATVESRAIGDAQAAYGQAVAKVQNARTNLQVVLRQAQAGVFSRAPVETARKAQADAAGDVATQETALRQARVALDNAMRLARVGGFASPALEAARGQVETSNEAVRAAQAALDNASAAVQSAQAELERRRQMAAAGAYQSQPLQIAQHAATAAQAARVAAESEVTTTRANLSRAKSLAAEGLVSGRDLEAAQGAYDQAVAHLKSAQSDETTAQQELERQRRLASTNVAGLAEVGQAQAALATAQADVRTRTAEVERARSAVRLANVALSREQAIFKQGIANRREVSAARAAVDTAQTALFKARQTLAVTSAALTREQRIYHENLNNVAQVQAARAADVQAQADLKAARSALALLKSSPGSSVTVPVTAPMSGVVQDRNVAVGEAVDANAVLMTIVNLNTVALEAALPERDFAHVRYGSVVRATVDALPGRTFVGRINFLSSSLDPTTRTVTARAVLDNPGVLRPGMFAHGRIETGAGPTALVVPSDAVQTYDSKTVVFAPGGKPGEFVPKEVQPGATVDKQTVITSGLKPGERIVARGAFIVKAQGEKSTAGD